MAIATPVAAAPIIHQELEEKIPLRQARIGIIGMGYVGLPLALLFGDEGHAVTGFDIDVDKVEKLTAGDSYIARIGISEVQKARARGFSATTDYSRVNQQSTKWMRSSYVYPLPWANSANLICGTSLARLSPSPRISGLDN